VRAPLALGAAVASAAVALPVAVASPVIAAVAPRGASSPRALEVRSPAEVAAPFAGSPSAFPVFAAPASLVRSPGRAFAASPTADQRVKSVVERVRRSAPKGTRYYEQVVLAVNILGVNDDNLVAVVEELRRQAKLSTNEAKTVRRDAGLELGLRR